MRFKGKILEHKSLGLEAIANVEFSEGDLIELKGVCIKADTEWGNILLADIQELLIAKQAKE